MSLGVILTIIFVVLFLTGAITWPLWVCFTPIMAEVVLDIVILVFVLTR